MTAKKSKILLGSALLALVGLSLAYYVENRTALRWPAAIAKTPSSQIVSATQKPAENKPVENAGLPERLVIARLAVDAKIEYMGTTPQGAMEVPANVEEAGWYKYGAHPGDEGSSVIAGHLDGTHGEPGVFINLNKMQVGDTFSVINDLGESKLFVVRQIRTYGQNEQPTEVFHSQQGSHLNLITCTGAWNKTEKRFFNRLVVFADKAS